MDYYDNKKLSILKDLYGDLKIEYDVLILYSKSNLNFGRSRPHITKSSLVLVKVNLSKLFTNLTWLRLGKYKIYIRYNPGTTSYTNYRRQ